MSHFPKIAVLVSGNGSNLQSVIDHIQKGELEASIAVVISNKSDAYALTRAQKANIPTKILEHTTYTSRAEYDRALLEETKRYEVEYVVLAGFMRILGPEFLSAYQEKTINIHPSLLPKYPGMNAIEHALLHRESETGVTVHYVNEGVDTGPVIMQERVTIDPSDTLQTLQEKVQKLEHQIYPKAIKKVLWNK